MEICSNSCKLTLNQWSPDARKKAFNVKREMKKKRYAERTGYQRVEREHSRTNGKCAN